jgi:predicted ATPase/DNA-binding SARP family transcriptional activator
MEVGVLGPVVVEVPVGTAQPGKRARALAAVLALAGAETPGTDELVARVWPAPPPDPGAALDGLRAQLPEGNLETDLDRFTALTSRAQELAGARDLSGAGAALDEALALWRGEALEDLRDTAYLQAEAGRLTELRLTATEDRLDLALGSADGAEQALALVSQIRGQLGTYPTRERLWALLMSALYAGERRDEAIAVYAEARATLADELGIEPGEALQQLQAGILHNGPDGPAVGTTDHSGVQPRKRGRIPVLSSTTYGRDELTAQVAALVVSPDVRMVTLTGIGGSGKSRVAALVAAAVQTQFADVAYLQVTEEADAPQLLAEVALALGCPPAGDPADGLAGLDATRRVLVVLDNLESLGDARPTVRRLLDASAALTVLATSRLPLRTDGEHELPVPPLAVPGAGSTIGQIAQSPSVRLFADRAAAAEPTFGLDGQELAVAEVCTLLDGLPLAIELAAAHAKLRSIDRIIDGLRSDLDLLSTGSQEVPERQRAMTTAIRWSYERLGEDAQTVCDRLAVFERGFTIEAVEAVCPDVPRVVEALAAIVDARLVRQLESRADVRFAVLGTVRAYVRERLARRPDQVRTRELLVDHLTELAEDSRRRLYGPDGHLVLARFDDDAADVAAAVTWALETGRRPRAVELLLVSLGCWAAAGRYNEALGLTLRVLDDVPAQGPDAARLLAVAAQLSHWLTDQEQAADYGRRALELAERHHDREATATARAFLGAALVLTGRLEEGARLAEEAAAEAERFDLYPLRRQTLSVLAMARAIGGDAVGERAAYETRLRVARAKGDLEGTADTLNTLAEISLDDADAETARAFAAEAAGIAANRIPAVTRDATITLARAALVKGDLAESARQLASALPLSERLGQSLALAQCLRVGGCLALARADPAASVRLFAAAHVVSPPPGGGEVPFEQDFAAALAEARASLGAAAAGREWTLGSALPLAVARERLLEVVEQVSSPVSGPR